MLPPDGKELKGDEVDRIVSFKRSLGIDDPDAANMHMEVVFFSVCGLLGRLMVFVVRSEISSFSYWFGAC